MNFAVLQLAILFLPGIIWTGLYRKWSRVGRHTTTSFTVAVFVSGLVCHIAAYSFYKIFGFDYSAAIAALNHDNVAKEITDIGSFVDELAVGSIAALVLAAVAMKIKRHNLDATLVHWLRLTNRYGDEDVWDLLMNSYEVRSSLLIVRDAAAGLYYYGIMAYCSEGMDVSYRELCLINVEVLDETGACIRKVDQLLIGLDPANTYIEIVSIPEH